MLRDRWLGARSTGSFTLQWHLTNRCPHACSHCYDRSGRGEFPARDATRVLEDLLAFCRHHRVRGQACLTGGDPMAHPHFWDIYALAAAKPLALSILGNPVSGAVLDHLAGIRKPLYYQVSLEGLREHNDAVRGEGHFASVMAFLDDARARGIRTHVMLTLTRDNMNQVLPLAWALEGRAHRFTFNRLSRTGGGASLGLPSAPEYERFLQEYLRAARTTPVLAFKDNLFNIIRQREGRTLFRGCTGHGCGAAFNFVALLPDGEVHACRKFPSPIGRIPAQTLDGIYRSPAARAYRLGSLACDGCPLKARCGGCLAATHGEGMDPLRRRDPMCFIDRPAECRSHPRVAPGVAALPR